MKIDTIFYADDTADSDGSDAQGHSEKPRVVLANAQYRCAECGGLAVEVHHIIPVRDDWSKRLDIHNLVPLCTSCHNRRRQG